MLKSKDFSVESLLAKARATDAPGYSPTNKDLNKSAVGKLLPKGKQDQQKDGKMELKDDNDYLTTNIDVENIEEEEDEDDDSDNDSSELKELQQTLRKTIANQKEQAKKKQLEIIQETQTWISDKETQINEQLTVGIINNAENALKQLNVFKSKMQGKMQQIEQSKEQFQKQVNQLWQEYQDIATQAENQIEELQKNTNNKRTSMKRKLTNFKQEAQQQIQQTEDKLNKVRKSSKLNNINKLLNQFL
eukprot:TRINITY_DN378_c0_g3_i4.p3 TRINITY_DN378_c0_g3~~TRINITY_DN378_c0_g3_i4.p3  ORF type:complete len:247 (-),score=40.30 TRINITY_DN378_c0_g3_i4:781-1521(-)